MGDYCMYALCMPRSFPLQKSLPWKKVSPFYRWENWGSKPKKNASILTAPHSQQRTEVGSMPSQALCPVSSHPETLHSPFFCLCKTQLLEGYMDPKLGQRLEKTKTNRNQLLCHLVQRDQGASKLFRIWFIALKKSCTGAWIFAIRPFC